MEEVSVTVLRPLVWQWLTLFHEGRKFHDQLSNFEPSREGPAPGLS
jgi:hypothetical protein